MGVLAVAGCSLYQPLPEPLAPEEVAALVQEERRAYWEVLAPAEPFPDVEVVEVLPVEEVWPRIVECVAERGLPGVVAAGDGIQIEEGTDQRELEIAMFLCTEAYPPDYAEGAYGYLSGAELEYLWQYFEGYLVPCLRLHGVEVNGMPDRASFLSSDHLIWEPYGAIDPQPQSALEWRRLDAVCAPPPILQSWRPLYP